MKERKKLVLSETQEYIPLKYVGHRCPNCGRIRVEVWSNGWHICEKCNWCIETQDYVDMESHNLNVRLIKYSDEIWRAMHGE